MKFPAILCAVLVFLVADPARAERFVANILLDVKYADAGSRSSPICSWTATKNDVLTYWAGQFHANAQNLELVYDTDDDEIQVVKKSDGSLVATHLCFCDGTTLSNGRNTQRVRVAQIYEYAYNATTLGSAYGKISLVKDVQGSLTKFSWVAHFHLSLDEAIISGVLSTNEKFIPSSQKQPAASTPRPVSLPTLGN